MSNLSIHTKMQLHMTSERIFIIPETSNKIVVIDRLNDTVVLENDIGQANSQIIESRTIFGIIGIINLIAGPYLIVITQRDHIGDINDRSIFQVQQTEIISFRRTTIHLTEQQVTFNNAYISMIKSVLNTPYFYFSYTYDLSHSLQRIYSNANSFANKSLFERADKRFIWNQSLMSKFLVQDQELISFCLPIIHGFISYKTLFINNKPFKLTVVSRRSIHRAGTRLFCRGSDLNGNVANFVETEQIIEYKEMKSSFIQIRGSIPLVWNQYPTLKYKPKPQLSQSHNQFEIFKMHMNELQSIYGKVTLVNLINHKGQELVLEQSFQSVCSLLAKTNDLFRYESFDFHHECKNNRWDRLSILMGRLAGDIQNAGYFQVKNNAIVSRQSGAIRTNCIDSLDRTNVVQNLIAKKILEDLLAQYEIISSGEKIEAYPNIESIYRNVWADNADYCSIQYAGTGALKTDYTRTGKRSFMGLLKDGYNSMIRYYKNNFSDGARQDGIDLFLGFYTPKENEGKLVKCPLESKKDWKYFTLPILLVFSTSMFLLSFFMTTEFTSEVYFYLLFWSGMIAVTFSLTIYNGPEFVDNPKLNPIVKNEKKSPSK